MKFILLFDFWLNQQLNLTNKNIDPGSRNNYSREFIPQIIIN